MEYAYKLKSLYNGTNNAPQERVILLLEDGLVSAVVPWSAEHSLTEKGITVQDYGDYYATPGLIDSHVHIMLPGDGASAEDYLQRSHGEIQITAARNVQIALENGITALRDCGAWPQIVFDLRRAIEHGAIAGPDLVLCGSALTVTGGHTHFFGGEVDTVDETVKMIRQQHKMGADFVKLIATGGGTRRVIQHGRMLSAEQMIAATEEAHRLGTVSTAHVCTTDTIRLAVDCRVDMLEHLIWADNRNNLAFDPALAEEIAHRDTIVCHTLSVLPCSVRRYEKLGRQLTAQEQAEYDMLRRFCDTVSEGFRLTCHDIRYVPATDAGWRYSRFDSLVDSMIPMAELGLSNLEVLHSATGLAAAALGLEQKLGALTAGKQADFILLKADPLACLENLRHPEVVFKKGVRIVQKAQPSEPLH